MNDSVKVFFEKGLMVGAIGFEPTAF